MKILIAEDEITLQESIIKFLNRDAHICETASDYYEAISKVSIYEYDLILLDINLITGNGLDLLKLIKKEGKKIPVIIISANNSLDDKVEGLDLGADDYLTKPFHLTELNSRIKAVMRRGKYDGDSNISFNEIKIKTDAMQAYVNEKPIQLTKKEYDLLVYFITNKNRVLSKEVIAEHLWGDNIDTVDSFDFIYVHINHLRKKLTDVAANYIRTVYRIGYKFMDEDM
ncbi:response regulator transcription factor [Flavivirga rizhaonensis]|uniref:Response regulator transcription factor n=1 Tax=Flavivirga rizhaonensis TaxID=2559571 RepID=A0A4S1E2K8_9FLAO|nr:response regulator transcription factor [Flavivirga rizhaonensis]TGV04867.1 response regulator transcription factor [Flavivirga rizhaonensis]